MAERRMFAKTIIDSDAFLEMPATTQMLYFHLAMRADDEGFLNNPKRIMKMIGAAEDDMKLLLLKRFILAFDSGVIVIKHWKIHNYIQSDRFKPTVYKEERATLELKDNGAYTETPMYTPCIQDGYTMDTQDRLEIVKSKSKDKKEEPRHLYGQYKNVLLSDSDYEKLQEEFADYLDRIDNLSAYMASTGKSYKNHLATIRNWARRDNERKAERTAAVNKKVHNFPERENDYNSLVEKLTGELNV